MQFPLLGLARDFHPLDNAHAERTQKAYNLNLNDFGCTPFWCLSDLMFCQTILYISFLVVAAVIFVEHIYQLL